MNKFIITFEFDGKTKELEHLLLNKDGNTIAITWRDYQHLVESIEKNVRSVREERTVVYVNDKPTEEQS